MYRLAAALLAVAVVGSLSGGPTLVGIAVADDLPAVSKSPRDSFTDPAYLDQLSGGRLLAYGRVDEVNADVGSITLLGNSYSLLSTEAARNVLSTIHVGDVVALIGEVVSLGGSLVDAVLVSDHVYVPGSTPVYLRARVDAVAGNVGALRAGSLLVDTNSLGLSITEDVLGSVGVISGTRPTIDGILIASRLRVEATASVGTGRAATNASVGTGRQSGFASVGTGRAATG